MNFAKKTAAALLVGSTALVFAVPATSAPLIHQSIGASTDSGVQQVRFRGHGFRGGRHFGHRGFGHRRYGYRRGYGGGGAVLGGLAAGAIIGGAIAASSAGAAGNSVAYCEQRFHSYDPASGTYLGYDGARHACP